MKASDSVGWSSQPLETPVSKLLAMIKEAHTKQWMPLNWAGVLNDEVQENDVRVIVSQDPTVLRNGYEDPTSTPWFVSLHILVQFKFIFLVLTSF